MTDISYRLTITPPLSREEEQTCLCRAQYYNDENALEQLVTSNYAYMVGRTKQIAFASNNSEHSDALLSSAVHGMLIAINRFDLQLIPKVRLRSYATHWIDRYIKFGIIELTWSRYPRLPNNVRRLFEAYKTLRKRHEHATGRVAHHREILVDTELQKYEDVFHFYVEPNALSLDTPTTYDDDDGYLHERIAGDIPDVDGMLRSIDSESALLTIKQKLADMPAQMREVIEQSYGIACPEKTLTEIARNNNMSRERARQLRERGLRSLKRNGIELSAR
jgi:RNA polymerase primary sigma factor